jgi:uncharacterized membrane protein
MTMITLEREDRASRYLLVGSLALNLFFIAGAGALAMRHILAPSQPSQVERVRTAASRIERLAAPLPAADAEKLRGVFRERAAVAEAARDALNGAFENVQAALRAEPFDAAKLGAAFAAARAARPAYEMQMQEIIAAAAQAMSHDGRSKLAEWPPARPNSGAR